MLKLTAEDHSKASAAIAEAEAESDAEIIAIATPISDSYHDVGLHWAVLALFGTLAIFAWQPQFLHFWFETFFGGWRPEPALRELLTLLLVLALLKFTGVLLLLKYMPLRMLLTPGATKTRRVRRRAIALFKAAAERRTVGRNGVLIYLSAAEHRAEIVADRAIVEATEEGVWGEAMTALITEVKAGRPGDGIAAAVREVGKVCAVHFPRSSADTNEIPDKLIEL